MKKLFNSNWIQTVILAGIYEHIDFLCEHNTCEEGCECSECPLYKIKDILKPYWNQVT